MAWWHAGPTLAVANRWRVERGKAHWHLSLVTVGGGAYRKSEKRHCQSIQLTSFLAVWAGHFVPPKGGSLFLASG